MKLLIGLGNPGSTYTNTRHNAGFMAIDLLARRHASGEPVKARFQGATIDATIAGEKALLLKPTTYMNLSGQSVAEAVRFFKLDPVTDVLVIVDDLYLPVGAVRLKPGGGTGGHNGLESIRKLLARDDYPRLRVGVGVAPAGGKPPYMDQADFVLSRFSPEEQPQLEASIARAADAAELFVAHGLTKAMNFANAGPAERKAKPAQTSDAPTPPPPASSLPPPTNPTPPTPPTPPAAG